jgi:hypothetical protein
MAFAGTNDAVYYRVNNDMDAYRQCISNVLRWWPAITARSERFILPWPKWGGGVRIVLDYIRECNGDAAVYPRLERMTPADLAEEMTIALSYTY